MSKVYVREGDDEDRVYAMLRVYSREAVKIIVDTDKFHGAPN
jgi:hypothetical protein